MFLVTFYKAASQLTVHVTSLKSPETPRVMFPFLPFIILYTFSENISKVQGEFKLLIIFQLQLQLQLT